MIIAKPWIDKDTLELGVGPNEVRSRGEGSSVPFCDPSRDIIGNISCAGGKADFDSRRGVESVVIDLRGFCLVQIDAGIIAVHDDIVAKRAVNMLIVTKAARTEGMACTAAAK